MKTGTVKFFNSQKGFGFIINDEDSKEIFVHTTDVLEPISEGDSVIFGIEETKKGLKATEVSIER